MSASEAGLIRYEVITLRGSSWCSDPVDVISARPTCVTCEVFRYGINIGLLFVRRPGVKEGERCSRRET